MVRFPGDKQPGGPREYGLHRGDLKAGLLKGLFLSGRREEGAVKGFQLALPGTGKMVHAVIGQTGHDQSAAGLQDPGEFTHGPADFAVPV